LNFTEKIACQIGYPGKKLSDKDPDLFYSPEFGIWIARPQKRKNRYVNYFGVGRPQNGENVSIAVEINYPISGINRRVSGVFSKSEGKNVCLLSRGRIRGLTKESIFDKFLLETLPSYEGANKSNFLFVCDLDSKFCLTQLSNFVFEINRLKSLNSSPPTKNKMDQELSDYFNESSGLIEYTRSEIGKIERIHGIIVSELNDILLNSGYKTGRFKAVDLIIQNRNRANTIFEIKTQVSLQSVATAVGQLLLYSYSFPYSVKKILVLPQYQGRNTFTKKFNYIFKRIKTIGIDTLFYRWNKSSPIFLNLEDIL